MRSMLEDMGLPISEFVKHIAAGTASYQLVPKDRTVVVAATDATGDITISLPSPAECLGLIISIRLVTKATSNVVISTYKDASDLATLDTSGDDAVFYCDGFEWYEIGGTNT